MNNGKIKFAILAMIGTIVSSIALLGCESDAAASQNSTSITNDTSSNIEGHLFTKYTVKKYLKR